MGSAPVRGARGSSMLTLNDLREKFNTIFTLTSAHGFLIYLMSDDYDSRHMFTYAFTKPKTRIDTLMIPMYSCDI